MYPWVTHTWNAIKGKCPHGCHYCYMKRWGEQPQVRFDESELKTNLGSRNSIFVGSSCDMWAGGMPYDWVRKTLSHCRKYTSQYLFQSKNPERMVRLARHLPAKTITATTIETNREYKAMGCAPPVDKRAVAMGELWRMEFGSVVTIEPIMDFDLREMIDLIKTSKAILVNIGANTSHRVELKEPAPAKVAELIYELGKITKIKIKPNLNRIYKAHD